MGSPYRVRGRLRLRGKDDKERRRVLVRRRSALGFGWVVLGFTLTPYQVRGRLSVLSRRGRGVTLTSVLSRRGRGGGASPSPRIGYGAGSQYSPVEGGESPSPQSSPVEGEGEEGEGDRPGRPPPTAYRPRIGYGAGSRRYDGWVEGEGEGRTPISIFPPNGGRGATGGKRGAPPGFGPAALLFWSMGSRFRGNDDLFAGMTIQLRGGRVWCGRRGLCLFGLSRSRPRRLPGRRPRSRCSQPCPGRPAGRCPQRSCSR